MIKFHRRERFDAAPEAVLLDTDNTLYPYDPAHAIALGAVRQKIVTNFSISAQAFDEAFSKARADVKARLGPVASGHSRLLYFQRMLELMRLGSQVLLALDLEQTYWRVFLANAELFAGVREFLDDLRIAGIPLVVVTDLTAQIQFRKMVYFGLDHYCDYIVTSEEAGFDKPHAAPFELAIAKLKVDPARTWMIGDSPKCDIGGARRAVGAITLQKLHKGIEEGAAEFQPDCAFTEFDDLRIFLKNLTKDQLSQA